MSTSDMVLLRIKCKFIMSYGLSLYEVLFVLVEFLYKVLISSSVAHSFPCVDNLV